MQGTNDGPSPSPCLITWETKIEEWRQGKERKEQKLGASRERERERGGGEIDWTEGVNSHE